MKNALSDALAARDYTTLTPVQEAVTKPELDGADLLVSAQTGSGKTVGFSLAIASTILENERFAQAAAPLALIWTPLRVATLRECIDSGMVFNESRYKWLSFCFDSFFVPYLKFLATGPNKNGTSDDVLARIVGILCKDAFHTRFDHNLIRARCFDTGKTTHFRSAPLPPACLTSTPAPHAGCRRGPRSQAFRARYGR